MSNLCSSFYKRPIQLKPRLLALASLVPRDSRVADIGTDHARIPIYLLQQGITTRVIATDIRSGPLSMAAEALRKHGLEAAVELRLGSGASCLSEDEIDTAIIAGMGGDTIADILTKSLWLFQKHLILQPQTHPEKVLEALRGYNKHAGMIPVQEGRRTYILLHT